MIEGYRVLCISPTTWDSLWRNRQQIMSRLSKKNEICFFEPQDKLSCKNLPSLLKPAAVSRRGNENLKTISMPPALPFLGTLLSKAVLRYLTPLIVRINTLILANFINTYIRSLSNKKTILWIYNPLDYGLAALCPHDLLVYYVYDETAFYPQNRGIAETIDILDTKLSQTSHLLFASSELQRQKRSTYNPNSILIQNTADFDHFNRPQSDILPMPRDLNHIREPIIGCSGFLGFHIDMDLLLYIANARPEWSLVLLGPDNLKKNNTYASLKSCNNVHFLGQKPYTDLPRYFHFFKVGLMPYDLSTHVTTSFPLRCFEYMACGVPVVSVRLETMAPIRDLVHICDNYEAFVSIIDTLLTTRDESSLKRAIDLVRNNSWESRVEQISESIMQMFAHA